MHTITIVILLVAVTPNPEVKAKFQAEAKYRAEVRKHDEAARRELVTARARQKAEQRRWNIAYSTPGPSIQEQYMAIAMGSTAAFANSGGTVQAFTTIGKGFGSSAGFGNSAGFISRGGGGGTTESYTPGSSWSTRHCTTSTIKLPCTETIIKP